MDIIKSPAKAYGFTLRKVKLNDVTKETYLKHMARLPALISDVVYENERGLHCHGVCYINKGIDKKRFRFRGWHIKLEELYDPQQWTIYCNKHQQDPTHDMVDTPPEHDFIPPKISMFRTGSYGTTPKITTHSS